MEENYDEEVQRLLATAEAMAARPIKASYAFATIGSKTRMGGEVVTAPAECCVDELRIACVGDVIRYPNGSESQIVSGAGFAAVLDGRPLAIVGSAADNGDTIVSSLQSALQLREYVDGDPIPGLLQPGYIPPTNEEDAPCEDSGSHLITGCVPSPDGEDAR
jgi:uncharacterized Zn-binding protein involved in type VI secretion